MTGPVIESRNRYNGHHSRHSQTHNSMSPVIDGYFPHHKTYKEMAISRINKTLCATLLLFILISAISYYFVTASEITLNKYRKQALALNDENVDLQNKLDYLKSYYNVDKAMQKQHLLQKAKNVIEVKDSSGNVQVVNSSLSRSNESAQKNSYQWSVGF